jgi:hypothetical protein
MSSVETIENNQTKQTTKSKGKKSSKPVKKVEDDEKTFLENSVSSETEAVNLLETTSVDVPSDVLTVEGTSTEGLNHENDESESSVPEIEEVSSPVDILNHIKNIENSYEFLSKTSLKNYDFDKVSFTELITSKKKIAKYSFAFEQDLFQDLSKEKLSSIKKQSKSKKGNKPKHTNTDGFAINIPHETYPQVLAIMKYDEGTQLSKTKVMQFINAYVKKEKTSGNQDILVQGDNRSFKIIGEIKELFDFIRTVMVERGDMESDQEFPKQLTYTGIFKYLKYCFPLVQK